MSVHAFIKSHAAGAPEVVVDWIGDFRRAAALRFVGLDVPTRRAEEWRFFDVRPIVESTWRFAASASDAEAVFAHEATCRVDVRSGLDVRVEGELPGAGVYVGGLAKLPEALRGTVLDALGNAAAPYADDLFCAMNGASLRDVVCVIVPADTVIEAPIHVLFTAPDGDGAMQHTRLLVIGARGSKFTVVEDYASPRAKGRHFTNAVAEFVVGPSANVSHVRVQRENRDCAHIGRTAARVGAHARYDSVSVAVGSASARNDIWVSHEGDGGWSRIDGLAIVDGKQQIDTHSVIDNTRPHCESHQLHKCVVAERGHAVFNGKIFVRKGAQRTDAYQLNRNLLMTPGARVDTKPQLEIFADDVKCTHGATVGQLDEEQVFYLVSRGISPAEARATLTYAFAAEVIETIGVPSIAGGLQHEAFERTRGGER